jgi:hypothetical protein
MAFQAGAGSAATPAFTFTADSNTGIFSPGSDQVAIATNGSNRLYVGATGNMGVDQPSPATRLDLNGNYASNVVALTSNTVDCSLGNYFTRTINANSTFSFTNIPSGRAFGFTLELTHTSGTVTWPAAVEFNGGVAPTLTTGRTHLFVFITDDGGSRWRGVGLVDYNN